MQVLFLGGPWHGERHDVPPCRRARGADGLPTVYSVPGAVIDAAATNPVFAGYRGASASDRVVYTRRFAQGGGVRRPVYVAPDYHGPPRA